MPRAKSLIPLSHDHYHGLRLAQLLKKNAAPSKTLPNDLPGKLNYAIDFYHSDLREHFTKEEEILFPFIEGKSREMDALVTRLKGEHGKIKEFIEIMFREQNPDEQWLSDKLHETGLLLENHIRLEERELFPMIEQLLSESELKTLENKFL